MNNLQFQISICSINIIIIISIIITIVLYYCIIMQNLYSAISESSMTLYNNCNFKKKVHLSY